VFDQFYKRFILGLLFTQGCESETDDVKTRLQKNAKNEMQIFFFNESYIRDGEEVQLSSTKTPNSQMQSTYLHYPKERMQLSSLFDSNV
jgi:hypothetical protein